MSAFDKAVSALKDVLTFREQLGQVRQEMAALSGNVAALVGDIRELEQRLARVEGFIEGATAATVRRQPRLPRK